jgi:hypothetical protein
LINQSINVRRENVNILKHPNLNKKMGSTVDRCNRKIVKHC